MRGAAPGADKSSGCALGCAPTLHAGLDFSLHLFYVADAGRAADDDDPGDDPERAALPR